MSHEHKLVSAPLGKNPGRKIPEAEVTLRLAFWFLSQAEPGGHAELAIDGAHVCLTVPPFPIKEFLKKHGWAFRPPSGTSGDWRGIYVRKGRTLNIASRRGFDFQMSSGAKPVAAECKGGPLEQTRGKGTHTILAEAIGQALTADAPPDADIWVAVPDSPGFEKAGRRIACVPAFQKTGIRIALVNTEGEVRLLNEES